MLPRVHRPALNVLQGHSVLQMWLLPPPAGPVLTLMKVQVHARRVSLGIRAHRALGRCVLKIPTLLLGRQPAPLVVQGPIPVLHQHRVDQQRAEMVSA
jgi:hypothetical protein